MISDDQRSSRASFEREVSGRFGVMPNFFRSASDVPGLIEAMWAFAKSAYLDCPLPPIFKERLFVHLSRFCEIRYCIVRHVGFLIGEGRPAGDPEARPATIEQVTALLRRPLPDANALAIVFDRLESSKEAIDIPAPNTQAEYDLFDALTVMVVEPSRSKRAREAVRHAVGNRMFEILTAFIAFVRTAHFWTETHPELAIEPDMHSVLERHDGLAWLLLNPAEAERVRAREALCRTLAELEDVKASLRLSNETLEIALQSAGQFAWEIDIDANDLKIIGDPRSALGFELAPTAEEHLANIHPDDLPRVTDACEAMIAGNEPRDIEHRLINPTTGETVWIHVTGRLLSDNGRAKLVGTARNITARKTTEVALREREERLQTLVGELQHRTRNLISVVGAIANETLKTSKTFGDFKASFQDRLEALARVQGLFFRMPEGDRITFDELLETELCAQSVGVGENGSITLDGPKGVRLRSSTVQTLALVLHELVTNAIKYGALNQPNGRLSVRWRRLEIDGKPSLHLDWKESGVDMPPSGNAPHGTGQGKDLIEHALRYQFAAPTTFAMEPDGVHFTVSLPVSELGLRGA
jgi:PAS domain S-box-containing protein